MLKTKFIIVIIFAFLTLLAPNFALAVTADPIAALRDSAATETDPPPLSSTTHQAATDEVEPIAQNKVLEETTPEKLQPTRTEKTATDCPVPASTILFGYPPRDQITCPEFQDPALTGAGPKIPVTTTTDNRQPTTNNTPPRVDEQQRESRQATPTTITNFDYSQLQTKLEIPSFSYADYLKQKPTEPASTRNRGELAPTGPEKNLILALALATTISTTFWIRKKSMARQN